jgi:hypothetical protein
MTERGPPMLPVFREFIPHSSPDKFEKLKGWSYVGVKADPSDGRSNLVTLTDNATVEHYRLESFGLKRFSLFVRDWESEDVRRLTELLWKLQQSMCAVSSREQRRPGDVT